MRRFALLLSIACAHAPRTPPGYGLSRERAAEVCLPPGEKAYLANLRCPDGSTPHIRRLGNVGSRIDPLDPDDPRRLLQMDPERPLAPGEPDFHIVEAAQVQCANLTYTIFIDMYHCLKPAG